MGSEAAARDPGCLSFCGADLLQLVTLRRGSQQLPALEAQEHQVIQEARQQPCDVAPLPSGLVASAVRPPGDEAAGSAEGAAAAMTARLDKEENAALASDNESLREKLQAAELAAAAQAARAHTAEAQVKDLEQKLAAAGELEAALATLSARLQQSEGRAEGAMEEAAAKEGWQAKFEECRTRADVERRELQSQIELLAGVEKRGESQVAWLTEQLSQERTKYEDEIKRLQAAETRNEERIILMVKKQQEAKQRQEQKSQFSEACGC